jgi:hypothetical protein
MHCDISRGHLVSLRCFIQGSELEAHINRTAPDAQGAAAWQCSGLGPTLCVVRQVAPNGQMRVLMTNLTATQAPEDAQEQQGEFPFLATLIELVAAVVEPGHDGRADAQDLGQQGT